MTKVGVISDTHNLFCPKVKEFLKECEVIFHAGDFGSIECADSIKEFKPLVGVYGNIDNHIIRLDYPKFQLIEVEGVKILMTHIGGYPMHYDREAEMEILKSKPNIFISGHSHILKVMNDSKYNLLHINPGAAGSHGFHRVRTAIRMSIDVGVVVDMEVGEWSR